jgi:hypothetical protein
LLRLAVLDCDLVALEHLLAHPSIDVNKAARHGRALTTGIGEGNVIAAIELLLKHPTIEVNQRDEVYGRAR